MNRLIAIFFVLSPIAGMAQFDTLSIIKKWRLSKAEFLIDSVSISMKNLYIDPDNLSGFSVNVDKTSPGERAGKIYITRKSKVPIVRLQEVIDTLRRKYTLPILAVINGVLCLDTLTTRFESTAIKSMDVLKPESVALMHNPRKVVLIIATKEHNRKRRTRK